MNHRRSKINNSRHFSIKKLPIDEYSWTSPRKRVNCYKSKHFFINWWLWSKLEKRSQACHVPGDASSACRSREQQPCARLMRDQQRSAKSLYLKLRTSGKFISNEMSKIIDWKRFKIARWSSVFSTFIASLVPFVHFFFRAFYASFALHLHRTASFGVSPAFSHALFLVDFFVNSPDHQ